MGVLEMVRRRREKGSEVREGHFAPRYDGTAIVRIDSPNVANYEAVNISSFFDGIDGGLERDQPFMVLHDARGIPPVDLPRRLEFLRCIDARRGQLNERVVAYGAVVSSPFERGLVTAFAWFVQLSLPIRLFPSVEEAEGWLRQRHAEFAKQAPAHLGTVFKAG